MHIFSSHLSNYKPFLACKQTILSFINANKIAFHLSLLKYFSHVWKYVIAQDLTWNSILLRFQIVYSFNPFKNISSYVIFLIYRFQSSMYLNLYCWLITVKVIRATFGKLKMFYTIFFHQKLLNPLNDEYLMNKRLAQSFHVRMSSSLVCLW